MGASFSVTDVIPASADRIYQAWLDPREHSAMTGGTATAEPRVGGEFSAWDGYITGRVLELEPGRRIVQAWRTNEFPDGAPDSRVEIVLEPIEGGTRIILHHTNVPDDQRSSYEQGWRDHYFQPMRSYFLSSARVPTGAPPADVDAGWAEEPARSGVGRGNGVHLVAAEAEEEAHAVWEPASHEDADEHELPTVGPAHKKKAAGASRPKAVAQAKKQAAPVKAAAKKPAKKPAVKAAAKPSAAKKAATKKAATKKAAKKPAIKAAAKKAAKAKKPAPKKKGPAKAKKAAKKGRR